MRASVLFTLAASFLSLHVAARISGFSAPSTLASGDGNVHLFITTENYIQSVQDVAFSFGISPANSSYPGVLGSLLSSRFVGPDNSNTLRNISHSVAIPTDTPRGDYVLTGAAFSLYGVSTSPTVTTYTINVSVRDTTSSDYLQSTFTQR